MKQIISLSSKLCNGSIGFNEFKLSYNTPVRYLLESGELETGPKKSTDYNWSPHVYHIHEALVQKNQPILYWLEDDEGNGPKRFFVREELLIVKDMQLPPKWILMN